MADNGKQTTDIIGLLHEGYGEFKDQYVEMIRQVRADVTQPLDPGARKLTPDERKVKAAAMLGNPTEVNSIFAEQAARFKLKPKKPIPRRLAEYVLRAARETEPDRPPSRGEEQE